MSQVIPIEHAKPGMMIVQVTAQNGPVRIKKSGLITSATMIQGLMEMGVMEIEYDPEQTVEICADNPAMAIEQTPTQALLRGHYDTRARNTDSAMSDQFNRSLFLPTVNGLPGLWRRSVKPAMLGVLMTIGGVATGYVLAVAPGVIAPLFSAPLPTMTQSPRQQATETSQTAQRMTVVDENEQQPVPVEQVEDKPIEVEQSTALTGEVTNVLSDDVNDGMSNTTINEDNAADEEKVSVSPELMARFNKVITELEKEEQQGVAPASANTVVTVHDDIPRVDQLPARLLTRLPAMDFSAHMYASARGDRWVRVNGEDKGEGDWIADRVQIVNIEAQRVILRFEDEVFSMSALTDW